MTDAEFLTAFESGEISPHDFRHADHVRAGWLLLADDPSFAEAAARMSRALRRITARHGHPERYNETITVAFMALIGERRAAGSAADFATFRAANADLFTADALARYYPVDILRSDLARRTFVLPRPT